MDPSEDGRGQRSRGRVWFPISKHVVLISRITVGALFVVAGVGKLADESRGAQIAPVVLEGSASWMVSIGVGVEAVLPVAEIVVGLGLLSTFGRRVCALFGTVFGILFLGVALAIPEGMSCSCFGVIGGIEGRVWHVSLAVLIVVTCGFVCICRTASGVGGG